jgi:predicted nucleic acid-binding protein
MIFLDTGLLFAFYCADDAKHGEAVELMEGIVSEEHGMAHVSDYIIDELASLVFVRRGKAKASEVARNVRDSFEMVYMDKAAFGEAFSLFEKESALSFTDCSTLVLMRRHGIRLLATFDSGFRGKVKTIGV